MNRCVADRRMICWRKASWVASSAEREDPAGETMDVETSRVRELDRFSARSLVRLRSALADNARATTHPIRYTDNARPGYATLRAWEPNPTHLN
jgi:hypothetical protein